MNFPPIFIRKMFIMNHFVFSPIHTVDIKIYRIFQNSHEEEEQMFTHKKTLIKNETINGHTFHKIPYRKFYRNIYI